MLDNINTNSNSPGRNNNGSNGSNNGNNNANNSIRPVMPNPLVQNVVNTNLPQGQIPFRPQVQQPQVQPQMQQRPQQAQVQPQVQPQMQQPRSQTNSNKDSEEIIRYCRSLASDINLLKEQFANQITELKLLLDKVVPTIEQNHHINNLAQQNIQQSIQQNFQQIVETLNSSNTSNASLKSEFSQLVEANNKYISKDDFNKGVNFIVGRLSNSLNSNGSSDNNNEISEKIGQLTSSINNFAGQLAQVQKHQQLQQAQLKQLVDYLANSANASVSNPINASNVGNASSSTANNKPASQLNPANNQSTPSNTKNSNLSQSTNPIKQLLEKDIALPFVSYQVNVKTLLIAVGVIGVLLLVVIGS